MTTSTSSFRCVEHNFVLLAPQWPSPACDHQCTWFRQLCHGNMHRLQPYIYARTPECPAPDREETTNNACSNKFLTVSRNSLPRTRTLPILQTLLLQRSILTHPLWVLLAAPPASLPSRLICTLFPILWNHVGVGNGNNRNPETTIVPYHPASTLCGVHVRLHVVLDNINELVEHITAHTKTPHLL